jgi:uncharacterized MnhB-related membrane protein
MNLLKWSVILTYLLFGLAFLGAVLYVFTPTIISALGGNESACDYNSHNYGYNGDGLVALNSATYQICNSSKAVLGIGIMMLIILSGIFSLVAAVLETLEIINSKNLDNGKKILWLLAVWFVSIIGIGAYYLTDHKKTITS